MLRATKEIIKWFTIWSIGVAALITAIHVLTEEKAEYKAGETLFQYSTFGALLNGIYDGNILFETLSKYGNFGLGVLNELDGEMLALDGIFYQFKTDGSAHTIPALNKSPFASLTFFEPDAVIPLSENTNLESLEKRTNAILPSTNYPYAIKIDGTFKHIKTRTIPKQKEPYKKLTEVVKNQTVFNFQNIEGTIVGFWLPEYLSGMNIPGYHFHFISKDKKSGGHLLEFTTNGTKLSFDETPYIHTELPRTDTFRTKKLSETKKQEIYAVEKQ